MFTYQNTTCPYCGKPLTETDDLAVCPDCGTPHHRACYKEHGHCANEDKHAQGFSWAPPAAPTHDDRETNGKICPRCGAPNASAAHFCDRCGAPFGDAVSGGVASPQPAQQQARPDVWPLEFNERDFQQKSFDGIGVRDWMVYISTSVGYYLYNFKMQDDTGRKMSFTWSAMIFPFIYFLYRKVWGAAAIAFAADLLLKFPIVFASYFVPQGITLGLTAAAWTTIASVCSYVGIFINCLWGLFAVYLYRRTSARRIKALQQSSANEQDYRARLTRAAGPSRAAIICLCTVYFALSAASVLLFALMGSPTSIF